MKTYSSSITAYRTDNKGFWQRNFLTFVVRDRSTGDAVIYNLWDGDDSVTVQVRDQASGALEYRDYFGGGQIVAVDPIVRTEGTIIRNMTVTLSGVSQQVQDMIQGYDCRDARFEWHVGEADQDTGYLVDTPVCEFDGFVDIVEREDTGLDAVTGDPAQSVFRVSVNSHFAALLRTNPDMRSLSISRERSDDEIYMYAAECGRWPILWGKEGKKNSGGDGDDHGRDRRTDPDPYPLGRR